MSTLAVERDTNMSAMEDSDELDEEPGEVIESASPLKVGEERELNTSGIKKKLLKVGHGWETPVFGDEVTVHYVGTLLDGRKIDSTRDRDEPFNFKLGHDQLVTGLAHGIITMTKGEIALFTLPPGTEYRGAACDNFRPNEATLFEVELISWITVVDICKDGGILKRILEKGARNEQPSDLDEVIVWYQVMLDSGAVVAKTPEAGMEFHMKDGHFCPALPKAIKTMKRGEKVKLIVQPQYAFGNEGRDAEDDFASIPPRSVLNIDLELVSLKPVIDVTGDSKVFKKILQEGEGTLTANEGAAVTIKYKAMLEDGTLFEKKGFDEEEKLEFITDEEQVIAGLDRAAATMKKGERAILTINAEYGFGSIEVKRKLAIVPPCSTLFYEVEMLDFTREKAPWEMSKQEKIDVAGKRKEDGNTLFKSGNYQRALKKYNKAVDYVSEDGSFGDEDQELVKALRVSCWLNGAACSLKLHDFEDAIKLCSKVLDVEFQNVKALYRRAQAFMETADLDLAELDIKKALEINPQNREVKSVQKTLTQLQLERNKRDSKLYMNMFSKYVVTDSSVANKKLKVEQTEVSNRDEEGVAMDV